MTFLLTLLLDECRNIFYIVTVEYTKEQQLYRNLAPSGHTLLTFCIRIGTFNCFHVSGLVQVLQVSYIIVTRVRVQNANMDH